MPIRFGLTTYGVIAGLGLLASGGVAATVTTATVSADKPLSPSGALTCSIYDVPTLESEVAPRAALLDGVPYVIVCDGEGGEQLTAAFIHRLGP